MKKSLIALAVAGAMVAPMVAQADATLYGRLSAELLDTDGTDLNLDDEIGGRIGIKGDVDLGLEGTKGLFHQEWQSKTGGDATLGAARLSYIGAVGGWGKFTVGRQYMPHWTMNANTYAARNPLAAEVGFLGNDGFKRISNVAKYVTPNMNGVTVQAAVILDGEAESGAHDELNAYNLLAQYKANGLSVVGSVAETNNDGSDDIEIWGLSAKYTVNAATLMARYEEAEEGSSELESLQLGVQYKIGNTTLKASWNKLEDETGADGDSTSLEVAHKLGKGEVYVGHHSLDDVNRTASGFSGLSVGAGAGDADTTYLGYLIHF